MGNEMIEGSEQQRRRRLDLEMSSDAHSHRNSEDQSMIIHDSGSMSMPVLVGNVSGQSVPPPPPPPPLKEDDDKFDGKIYKKLMPQIPIERNERKNASVTEIVQLINGIYDHEKKEHDGLAVSHHQPNL